MEYAVYVHRDGGVILRKSRVALTSDQWRLRVGDSMECGSEWRGCNISASTYIKLRLLERNGLTKELVEFILATHGGWYQDEAFPIEIDENRNLDWW